MIKVFIYANSTAELTRLAALVRPVSTVKLVGSNLGRADLRQQLADSQPDVLLESQFPTRRDELEETNWPDPEEMSVPRIWLVAESEFSSALALIHDSTIRGVLPTWASAKEIQITIETVAAGLLVIHPDVAEHLATRQGQPSGYRSDASSNGPNVKPGKQLSPRESQILNSLAAGLGNKEIAARLKISEHTVKFHITSIFNKLTVSSRAEAVAAGVRRGLIIL